MAGIHDLGIFYSLHPSWQLALFKLLPSHLKLEWSVPVLGYWILWVKNHSGMGVPINHRSSSLIKFLHFLWVIASFASGIQRELLIEQVVFADRTSSVIRKFHELSLFDELRICVSLSPSWNPELLY